MISIGCPYLSGSLSVWQFKSTVDRTVLRRYFLFTSIESPTPNDNDGCSRLLLQIYWYLVQPKKHQTTCGCWTGMDFNAKSREVVVVGGFRRLRKTELFARSFPVQTITAIARAIQHFHVNVKTMLLATSFSTCFPITIWYIVTSLTSLTRHVQTTKDWLSHEILNRVSYRPTEKTECVKTTLQIACDFIIETFWPPRVCPEWYRNSLAIVV